MPEEKRSYCLLVSRLEVEDLSGQMWASKQLCRAVSAPSTPTDPQKPSYVPAVPPLVTPPPKWCTTQNFPLRPCYGSDASSQGQQWGMWISYIYYSSLIYYIISLESEFAAPPTQSHIPRGSLPLPGADTHQVPRDAHNTP